jgi:hypothetical protein
MPLAQIFLSVHAGKGQEKDALLTAESVQVDNELLNFTRSIPG